MLDEIRSMFESLFDRMREGFSVFVSDFTRLGVAILFAAIVFGVIIASSYTINISAGITGKSVTFSCPTSNSYILPIFTSPTNMSAAFPAIQCSVNSTDIPVLIAYFVEVVAVVFLGAWAAISIFNLSG